MTLDRILFLSAPSNASRSRNILWSGLAWQVVVVVDGFVVVVNAAAKDFLTGSRGYT